jgi:feruloyl esterase
MKLLALTAVLLLSGCAARLLDPVEGCAAMKEPMKGVTIESATLVAPAPLMRRPKVPFSPAPPEFAIAPALPEHCQVIGAIAPADPRAPLIRFQVNLPTRWNGNSLQYGGGGFNGVLIDGLSLTPSARPAGRGPSRAATSPMAPIPDTRTGRAAATFALNDEALVNFAHASYRRCATWRWSDEAALR